MQNNYAHTINYAANQSIAKWIPLWEMTCDNGVCHSKEEEKKQQQICHNWCELLNVIKSAPIHLWWHTSKFPLSN